MNGIEPQLPIIVRLQTVSHHELLRFMYVYNVSDPIKSFEEIEVYYYDGVAYFAAIIGRVVTLIKVKYD